MVPQQVPFYSSALASGAPPAYGQPGFYASNQAPQAQGLPVQVGVPVFGSAIQQPFVHVANGGAGNVPNQHTHFSQAQQNNFAQGVPPNKVYAASPDPNIWQGQARAPCSPPPSSFPPGFEPGHKNNVTMGVSSQPRPLNTVAVGGPVVHPNQHHGHQQHQHVINQGAYQHPQQYQHQHGQYQPQPQHQYQHQQHQPQHQHQYQQHQYQHQQHQPQHQHQCQQHQAQPQAQHQHQQQQHQAQPQPRHQHQHQHQHQHPHPHQPHQPYQNQHSSSQQRQHQHQHEHNRGHHQQHEAQQQDLYQQNQHAHMHSQLQMQAQQFQNPHLHSHLQLQLQNQAPPAQLLGQPQVQPPLTHLQTPPQPMQFATGPQSLSQAQPACQQVPRIPAPFSNALQVYPPNIQADCANGVAIGLPVMPTPSHVDTAAPQTVVQIQQPAPAWQPGYSLNSLQSAPQAQSLNSSFAFSNNVQNNGPQATPKSDYQSNGWHPANGQRNNYLNIDRQTDPLQQHVQGMPQMKPDSQICVEATKSSDAQTFDQMRSDGHLASGKSHPSSFVGNNKGRWVSPPKSQIPFWANERNPLHALKRFQPRINGQLKSRMNGLFAAAAQKYGNGQHISQLQREYDSRGNSDVQKRSSMQPIKCDPCDRTFTSSQIMALHVKTHVKCGEEGCTFEASGKIVKEHRVTEHGKVEFQATYRGRKALALRSMEDKEDIKRWREERKKSYPTFANILHKAEDRKRMKAEGELIDEEAQKRRQRMRDVIARQKQLGYQLPEIPSHYFRTRLDGRPKKIGTVEATDANSKSVRRRKLVGLKRTAEDMETLDGADDLKEDGQTIQRSNGDFRKGHPNKLMSRHVGRNCHQNVDTGIAPQAHPPTLLSKLLHDDIQKENSYLLQCCRFIVNNAFFKDYSETSLKHFEWIVEAMPANGDGRSYADPIKMGAERPIFSNSAKTACGSENLLLSDSKDSVLEAEKKMMDSEGRGGLVLCEQSLSDMKDFFADRETKDAPLVPGISSQRKNQEQDEIDKEPSESNPSQPCLKNDTGKIESKVEDTAQSLSEDRQPTHKPNNALWDRFAVGNKAVSSVHTSFASKKPTSTCKTHLSDDDVEAGEVVSEQSESIVEDEEDISQYMNLDVNAADSGSCHD